MIEFILSLIKYTVIFLCMLYSYTKLLRIKLKVWDLFDIPLFIALSAVLYFVAVYVKFLVPIGLLISGTVFLFMRFRKTIYETVTVSTIALGISIVLFVLASILEFIPIGATLYLIKNKSIKFILDQSLVGIIQIVGVFFLFKIKRLQSGLQPNRLNATFEMLLFLSVGCIFTMMLGYTKNASYFIYETFLLVATLFGLILILWWFKHIKYNYLEAVSEQNEKLLKNEIEEYKSNYAVKEMQVKEYGTLIHYLNKTVPACTSLAERAAKATENTDARTVYDMLKRIMHKMNLADEKCSLQNIPETGVGEIDAAIICLFASAENRRLQANVEIYADVGSWFADNKLDKGEIHILFSYLCDNAINSAFGSPGGKVRVELCETENKQPVIRIYDSGEQFSEEVLAKLGLEQITTRKDGNGIGLITVFETLEKYGASFTLDEEPRSSGFTKFIEIVFDGRRSVTLRTYRESVVAACSARKNFTVERLDANERKSA